MKKILSVIAALLLFLPLSAAQAQSLKPYVLVSAESGADYGATVGSVKSSLRDAGFTIAGEYAPVPEAWVVVVTNGALQQAAAGSEHGGYGAVARVAITQVGDTVQVSYTNPLYFAAAYRLSSDGAGVASTLEGALGSGEPFGSADGITVAKLKKYHYMMGMPYFTDEDELASFGSHAEALASVEAGLAAGLGGSTQIYRVDIPGKDEVLFGVGLAGGSGGDSTVLGSCDLGDHKHSAYGPYEILVSGPTAYALPGKFRIALHFPDLAMGTFMKISGAPGAIRRSLEQAAASAE